MTLVTNVTAKKVKTASPEELANFNAYKEAIIGVGWGKVFSWGNLGSIEEGLVLADTPLKYKMHKLAGVGHMVLSLTPTGKGVANFHKKKNPYLGRIFTETLPGRNHPSYNPLTIDETVALLKAVKEHFRNFLVINGVPESDVTDDMISKMIAIADFSWRMSVWSHRISGSVKKVNQVIKAGVTLVRPEVSLEMAFACTFVSIMNLQSVKESEYFQVDDPDTGDRLVTYERLIQNEMDGMPSSIFLSLLDAGMFDDVLLYKPKYTRDIALAVRFA